MKPYVVLVEHASSPRQLALVVSRLEQTDGIDGAAAPPAWRKGGNALVEAFPSTDASAKPARKVISNLQHTVLPAVQQELGASSRVTLGGVAPEERDFVHAVYGNFPYVLGFVILLTFLLLMRAFRSVVLPLKAVILNLVSLALRVRRRRLRLPAGARERRDLGDPGDRRGDLLDPADDLRVPVRALDGLRGLHRHPHPRGLRRDARHGEGRLARHRPDRQARHERRARARVRVLLALHRARARTSSSSGSGSPPAS